MYFKGINVSRQPFIEKFNFLLQLFSNYNYLFKENVHLPTILPVMWKIEEEPNTISKEYKNKISYQIHHLQHRSSTKNVPFINFPINKNVLPSASKNIPVIPNNLLFIPPALPRFNFKKPQYKQKTVFEIKADLQNDIYHLYAFGKKSEKIYCGISYIPSYYTSKYMNSIFRNIKENKNLDSLEESDDEEDFQDLRIDKYVDLKKIESFECEFKPKFRRWVPIQKINGRGKIIHISQL